MSQYIKIAAFAILLVSLSSCDEGSLKSSKVRSAECLKRGGKVYHDTLTYPVGTFQLCLTQDGRIM